MGMRGEVHLFLYLVSCCFLCAVPIWHSRSSGCGSGPAEHSLWHAANQIRFRATPRGSRWTLASASSPDSWRKGTGPHGHSALQEWNCWPVGVFRRENGGVVAISYYLHNTGHHELERAFPVYPSADSAMGLAYSFPSVRGFPWHNSEAVVVERSERIGGANVLQGAEATVKPEYYCCAYPGLKPASFAAPSARPKPRCFKNCPFRKMNS
jgi:hypothetical protein